MNTEQRIIRDPRLRWQVLSMDTHPDAAAVVRRIALQRLMRCVPEGPVHLRYVEQHSPESGGRTIARYDASFVMP